jgi:hypothetical protein
MLHEQQPDPARPEPAGTVSRRKLIVTGATLAAAGLAVGAAASIPFSGSAGDDAAEAGDVPKKPVMVYLRSGGKFDVFVGQDRFQLEDGAFATRLTNAVNAL